MTAAASDRETFTTGCWIRGFAIPLGHGRPLFADRMIDDPAVRQVKVPLRMREPSRVVRRQADGRARGVELAEHLH